MIDWIASNSSQATAKNNDKVMVVCERCNQHRSQLYVVAKRKSIHHCLSCVKSNGSLYKTGEMVEYRCISCPTVKIQKYRHDRFTNWRCHHCAMVQGHKDGKFIIVPNKPSESGKAKLSTLAKNRWTDLAYREKWKKTRESTKEKRVQASKLLWLDPERLKKLSESLKIVWTTENYRSTKSFQSKTLWDDDAYRTRQKVGYTDAVREMMATKRAQQPSISTIQFQLYKYLQDLGVAYHEEGPDTTIGYYVFDCMVPKSGLMNKNLLIECQGDYWHSIRRSQQNDRSKFAYIDRYFPEYEVMYIWEHEFYTKNRVLDRLMLKLGRSIQTVDFQFSDIKLIEPPAADLKLFLDSYHYIGKGRGGKVVGAYHGDLLVGCVVFSPPLRQNMGNITELSRLCIHPSYHKRNFASWLVSRALRVVSGVVVAYADRTVGHMGVVYKACGFKLDHVVPSDYWYVDAQGYVMHKKTLYNRAVKNSLTEAEFAVQNGYLKQFGGEKLCYVKIC